MKILLINPIVDFYSEKINNFPHITLGLLYLAAIAEKKGHEVIVKNSHQSNFKRILKEIRPDIVGITCLTVQYNQALKIAEIIKKYDKKIITVAGGYHPTILWKEILEETDFFDYLCIGEGELTFGDLLDAISQVKSVDEIKGLAFKKDKKIIFTGERELISDLDTLPLPARHLVSFNVPFISSSRGCRNNCKFCSVKNFYGKQYRRRSVEEVIKEINLISNQGNKRICIIDDNFGGDREYILKISKAIRDAGLDDVVFEIDCSIAILADELVLKALQEMNVKTIGVGIQSSINEFRQYLNLIGDSEFLEKFFREAKKYNFDFWLFFPLNSGKENETIKMITDDLRSFMKIVKSNSDGKAKFFCELTVLIPFPGTDLEKDFVKRGIKIKKDWPLFRQKFCTYNYNDINENNLLNIIREVDPEIFIPLAGKNNKKLAFWNLIFLTDISFSLKIKIIVEDFYLDLIKRINFHQRLKFFYKNYF